jgi:hypothetical protein
MCNRDPERRVQSFADAERAIANDQFFAIGFTDGELVEYRGFADTMCGQITKLESGCKYEDDYVRVESQLTAAFRTIMLEESVPDAAVIIRCFLAGTSEPT